jgi:uncharacterized protein YodC (DUF2158 family)
MHAMILKQNDTLHDNLFIISASSVAGKVHEQWLAYDWFDRNKYKRHLFKSDNIGPEIIVTNIQDNGVYTAPVEIHYSAENRDESQKDDIFIKGNYKKGEKVTQPGEHILEIFAQDWTRNV